MNESKIGTESDGPVVQLHGDVRANSKAFGLPVVSDDGYSHDPQCYWCDGGGTNDTCARSIVIARRDKLAAEMSDGR